MDQVPEPQRGPAEMLEPTVDRFSWTVRGPRMIEVRQDVSPSPVERIRKFPELNKPGWRGRFHCIDQTDFFIHDQI